MAKAKTKTGGRGAPTTELSDAGKTYRIRQQMAQIVADTGSMLAAMVELPRLRAEALMPPVRNLAADLIWPAILEVLMKNGGEVNSAQGFAATVINAQLPPVAQATQSGINLRIRNLEGEKFLSRHVQGRKTFSVRITAEGRRYLTQSGVITKRPKPAAADVELTLEPAPTLMVTPPPVTTAGTTATGTVTFTPEFDPIVVMRNAARVQLEVEGLRRALERQNGELEERNVQIDQLIQRLANAGALLADEKNRRNGLTPAGVPVAERLSPDDRRALERMIREATVDQ